jgi:hypothetical protein
MEKIINFLKYKTYSWYSKMMFPEKPEWYCFMLKNIKFNDYYHPSKWSYTKKKLYRIIRDYLKQEKISFKYEFLGIGDHDPAGLFQYKHINNLNIDIPLGIIINTQKEIMENSFARLYTLLHEVGHYLQFKRGMLKDLEYYNKNLTEKNYIEEDADARGVTFFIKNLTPNEFFEEWVNIETKINNKEISNKLAKEKFRENYKI